MKIHQSRAAARWNMIGFGRPSPRRVAAGEWFYRAREIVLAEELPDIEQGVRAGGGRPSSKAIQHTSPEHIPVWADLCARDNMRRMH